MVRNRICYALTVVACFGFSMAYVGKTSHILLFLVLLYPVLAAVMAVVQLLFCGADFSVPRIAETKDTAFELMIKACNRFIFPAVPIELLCSLPDGDTGRFADKRLFISLPPFGETELSVRCRHLFRGSYYCEIKRIYIVDPLRLIRVSKKCTQRAAVTFLPRRLVLEEMLFRSAVEQGYAQKRLSSADKEDFSHVREYRDGDILQMVHWKLTAKQDELMIKQFESINDLRAVILCDYHQDDSFSGMTRADMVIETALAFVKTALDKGIRSAVDFGDLNVGASYINDEGSFNKFYDYASVIPPQLETEDVCFMLDRLDKSSAAILVVISDKLNEELLKLLRGAAQQVTVIYAFLNLEEKPLEADFLAERFLFLNIVGTSDDALENAARKLVENTGESL